ncbi:hypothetical protein EF294_15910 [Gordonia oryzae]|uniref:ESX-1 secretion-associated protein n=1 Tax=Gordonia oryzae TaxID=2487349 RepID=A0A3N4G611_9ACTN|nr:hypothetical protein [Gordonia oryzae]RPA58243.1 hypothetical protein EF294_15910 [Gordonia oryzae]
MTGDRHTVDVDPDDTGTLHAVLTTAARHLDDLEADLDVLLAQLDSALGGDPGALRFRTGFDGVASSLAGAMARAVRDVTTLAALIDAGTRDLVDTDDRAARGFDTRGRLR